MRRPSCQVIELLIMPTLPLCIDAEVRLARKRDRPADALPEMKRDAPQIFIRDVGAEERPETVFPVNLPDGYGVCRCCVG